MMTMVKVNMASSPSRTPIRIFCMGYSINRAQSPVNGP
jgi:hypothetical protein